MTKDLTQFNRMAALPRYGAAGWLRALLMAVFLLLPLTAPPARSELIQTVGLMADKTEAMTIDEVARATFRQVDRTMTIGYTTSVLWLRLRIDPAPEGGEVVVIVRPPMLDRVDFYAPALPATTASAATSAFQRIEVDWPASLRGYRITPPAGGADYYVRIASTGSIAANVTATRAPVANRINLITDVVQISYFALMLVLLLWSVRMWSLTGERLFGWFAAMKVAWLCHNILSFGYAQVLTPIVDRETLTLVFRNLVLVTTMLSVIFHRAVLIRFRPSVVAIRLLDLQFFGICMAFVLFWTYDRSFALRLNAYCILATPFIVMLNAFTARVEASPGLTKMRVIYTLLSAILLFWVVSLLGFGKNTLLSLYGFMVHGLTTGVLMFTILHLHARNVFAAARQAEAQIAALDQQRAHERERNRMLAQFIDMLTHEARNALAVINMSMSQPTISDRQSARVSDAILGLTGVIDRCHQTIRLDSEGQKISLQHCDLAEILGRLCDVHADRCRLLVRAGADGLHPVQSDPVLLGVVFGNLIENALKYSPDGSAITLDLDRGPEGVTVWVRNLQGRYGCPDPERVFQKYYRNQHAKARIGSGLGLYIVRGLLGMLSGRIDYEPQKDHVCFKVWLPC